MTTDSLILNILLFAIGMVLLVKGSSWFIDGAAFIAYRFQIPDAIVGLTLVSLGTSLPELATNIYAASVGEGSVAMGNVVGSNIANVLLILGVAIVCMKRIEIEPVMYRRDVFVMMAVYAVFAVFCYVFPGRNREIGRFEALLLLAMVAWYIVHLLRAKTEEVAAEAEAEAAATSYIKSIGIAVLMLLVGGAFIILGAGLMVDNVVWAARERFGVPEEVLSATVIAFGTSVPELAVTITGVLKGKNAIALGNVIGSNIFNLGLIMGVTAMITPVPVTEQVQVFLLPFMLLTGVVLAFFMRSAWALVRWEGVALLAGYVAYLGISILRII